jgi:hypothetical protein
MLQVILHTHLRYKYGDLHHTRRFSHRRTEKAVLSHKTPALVAVSRDSFGAKNSDKKQALDSKGFSCKY